MEENKTLTAKEVFDQIVALQSQITGNSNHSLHRMADALSSAFDGDSELSDEEKGSAITQIASVFLEREMTLQKMLTIYEKIYYDVTNAKSQ